MLATRGNDSGRDLNRQFPVKGWIDFDNAPLAEPEGNAVMDKLFSQDDWYLGTDNHGQGPDTYGAAGLQIVGQFDFQKSETLARFADGITESMKTYDVLSDLEDLRASTGQDIGAYHWGTLYDMLGYSASGSMIDYYNTADGVNGTGFATELTAGREVNWLAYPAALEPGLGRLDPRDQLHDVQARGRPQATSRSRSARRRRTCTTRRSSRDDDANGAGPLRRRRDTQQPYRVTRMQFFKDLNKYANRPLKRIRVRQVLRRQGQADEVPTRSCWPTTRCPRAGTPPLGSAS